MFADDTTVLVFCNTTFNTEIKTNTILNSLLQSFSQHNLYINKQKTNIIHFTTKNSKQPHLPAVFLADSILPHTSTTKFLGLLINENLSWNDHVKYLKSKLNSSLFILRRIIHNCDQNTAFSVYHGLIISLMSYGISLWGASSTNNLKDVLVIQKRALRYILSLNKKQSCRPYFKQHNLLTIPSLFIFQTLLLTRKRKNVFPLLGDCHSYETRNKNKFAVAQHRLKLSENSCAYIGVKLYNSLPDEIKQIKTHATFRKKLKQFLIDKTLYSVEDFFL